MSFLKDHPKAIVGMVHCLPLPGTAHFKNNLEEVKSQALADAHTLKKAGFTAIMIENMGDVPYQEKLEVEQIATLSAIAQLIKYEVDLPLGIDCAFSDPIAALSIAKAVGADFIRVPVFVDTVLFSDGIIQPSARKTLLFRKHLQAENIEILADIQVKHTYMLNSSMTLKDSAKLAEANGADAIVVTGVETGKAASINDLQMIKEIVKVPVFVGSGVNHSNIKNQLEIIDGLIVGSSIKPQGKIELPIDIELAQSLINY